MDEDSSWKNQLRLTKDDDIKSNSVLNIELILENDCSLKELVGFNEFDEFIYLLEDSKDLNRKKGLWQDSFESALISYIERTYNTVFDVKKVHCAIDNVARRNTFNPVKERIESQKWDGQARVETFFINLLGVKDDIYTRTVTKKWLTGLVARVYKPGIKFEIVPVLNGKQGIGKSTITKLLISEAFFSDSLDSLGSKKDDYLTLRGNVILELGELSSMRKTDIEKTKNFISASFDDMRDPFARNNIKRARKCVFIGTSNDSQYLKDLTGERRFFPLPCSEMSKLNLFDLDDSFYLQVLAEAKFLFESGYKIFFDSRNTDDFKVLEIAKNYQDDAKLEDPVRENVIQFLEMQVPEKWEDADKWAKKSYYKRYPYSKEDIHLKQFNSTRFILIEKVFTREILEIVFEQEPGDLLSKNYDAIAKKIALIIANLENWEKKTITKNGRRGRGFYNEVHARQNHSMNTC